jgi:4-amino-4-deoxy-L-arabinose transferase-like glycosyltransferase
MKKAKAQMNTDQTSPLTLPGSKSFRDPNHHWPISNLHFLCLFILLFAFALRMYHASTTLMWGDEGFSVYSVSRDLYAITFEGKDVDPHPPLFYYLLHFWIPLTGASELAIRFFSINFGTATVAMAWTLGRRLYSSQVGVVAAGLVALAPFAVQYSQEVRMYSLVMFLGALTTYLFLQWADHASSPANSPPAKRSKWFGISFFFSMLLAQYSLYQSAFLLVAQGVYVLPFLKTKFGFIAKWLVSSLAIVVLFLPWLVLHSSSGLADVKDVAGDTKPFGVMEFLTRGFSAIAIGPTIPLARAYTISEILFALVVLGLGFAISLRIASRNDWLLACFVAVPMLSLYPIYFLAPLYRGRLFALAMVPLLILLARAVTIIKSRQNWAAIPIGLFILGSYSYSLGSYFFSYNRYNASVDDYIPAIHSIEQRAQNGDVILFHAYWQTGYFLVHYRGLPVEYRLLDNQLDIERAASQARNVWAIVQGLGWHGGEGWLYEHAYIVREDDYGAMRVLLYRVNDATSPHVFTPAIQFDNGIALVGYRINDAPIAAGGVAAIELDWQAMQKVAQDYTVSVRLTRGDTVIAQADTPPLNGSLTTTQWEVGKTIIDRRGLVVPSDTLPGEYSIEISLYQFDSKQHAVVIAPAADPERSTVLPLTKIIVVK